MAKMYIMIYILKPHKKLPRMPSMDVCTYKLLKIEK